MQKLLTIETISQKGDFDEIAGEWLRIQKLTKLDHPFLDINWISGWWPQMVREGKKPIILVAYDNDIIVGFSSFQIVNTTFRVLEGFAQEFCDFVDWLCVPGMEDVVGSAFCQWLSDQKKSYDLIRCYNILPDGVCAQAIKKYFP